MVDGPTQFAGSMKARRARLLLSMVVFALLLGGWGASAAVIRWDPEELGPERVGLAAQMDGDDLRVVTFNAWRLRAPERVTPLIEAIDRFGAQLGTGRGDRPEVIAFQEIESRSAIDELGRQLGGDDGFFAACECAQNDDGSLRSAVGLSVRAPLSVREHECLPLGAIYPDHPRCALLAHLDGPSGRIDVAAVHVAWHPSNGPMIERLRRLLEERDSLGPQTVIAGDFNAPEEFDAYAAIDLAPLHDARPHGPPTHFFGGRVDYVLYGDAFDVRGTLDRRASYDIVHPAARLSVPSACAHQGPPACPISDHLPEGALLSMRSR